MSIPWGDVLQTKARLESHFSSVKVWDRDYGNYRSWDFGNANIVVFMLPLNKFAYTKNLLPTGVNKELSEAIVNGKQMYIAYTTKMDNKPCIYEARMNSGIFEAISGTAGSIFEHAKHRVPTIDEKAKAAVERIAISSRVLDDLENRFPKSDLENLEKTYISSQGVTHRIQAQKVQVYAQTDIRTQWDTGCDERLLLMR